MRSSSFGRLSSSSVRSSTQVCPSAVAPASAASMSYEDHNHYQRPRKHRAQGRADSAKAWRKKSSKSDKWDVSEDPAVSGVSEMNAGDPRNDSISHRSSSYSRWNQYDQRTHHFHHPRRHSSTMMSHHYHGRSKHRTMEKSSLSSSSSSRMMFPFRISKRGISTRIDSELLKSVDPLKKTALLFDLDGTLVDIRQRMALLDRDQTEARRYWSVVLHGDNYYLDRVIPAARAYIAAMSAKHNIVYLSGRRSQSIGQTYEWLRMHGYPEGYTIHRNTGVKSSKFKFEEMKAVKSALNGLKDPIEIVAYFGDRLWDDAVQAAKCGIRPVLVNPDLWISKHQCQSGLKGMIEENPHLFQQEHESMQTSVAWLKKTEFWDQDYMDLIPFEFCTDVYGREKGKWPPAMEGA